MAKADLTAERLRQLLYYNPDTGVFTWRQRRGMAHVGSVAGSAGKSGNLVIYVDGNPYQAHHLAWLYMHGVFPSGNIGHRNKNNGDNRIENLRDWSVPEKITRTRTKLTADRLRELIHYDPETGIFTRKVKLGKTGQVGDIVGSKNPTGRIEISVDGVIHFAHRIAWLYMYGQWPSKLIDHKDGDPSNNRLCNLRDVSQFGNMQNQRAPKSNNKSGFLGVRKKRGKWYAAIGTNGKYVHLGVYETPEDAHKAYLNAKRELHITCTI